MKPKPFQELAELTAPKTIIDCVEGKLTALYPPKEYASGKRQGEQYQNGEITSDGLKVFLKIDSPDLILPTSKKGSIIRIEAKQGSKGATGLYYEVGEYNDKETRTLKLTSTAVISWPKGGDSGALEPAEGIKSSTPHQDAPQRSSEPSRGHSGPAVVTPVRVRVANLLKIAKEVCEQSGKSYETFLEELTPRDILNAATGTGLSYKEGYVHHDPYFGDGALTDQPEHTWEGDPPKASKQALPRWQDFSHPKRGKLGEMDDALFTKFAAWALTVQDKDVEGDAHRETRAFRANVLMGVAEKHLTNKKIFLDTLAIQEGFGDTFDLDDLETVLGEQYSKATKNLTEAEWGECNHHLKKILQSCIDNHTEAKQQEDAGTEIPD